MARTIRRKNVTWNYGWVLKDWDCWISGRRISPNSKEGKKEIAKYHSDGGFGSYSNMSAPRYYRKMLNKRNDRREQNELYHWMKDPDNAEILPRAWPKEASWFW